MKKLISHLEQLDVSSLPGVKAQLKMAPAGRKINPTDENIRYSAVMLLLWEERSEPHTTLILRNTYKGVHSAQISLPGGKKELSDPNLEFTALRETEEEIGVTGIKVITELSEIFIPPSKFLVQPYVGYISEPPQYIPDEREVAEVFSIRLRDIINEANVQETSFPIGDGQLKIKAPYFHLNGQVVWGATAMILSEFKDVLIQSKIF